MKYRSSIPKAARERVTERWDDTGARKRTECWFQRKLVGERWYDSSGALEYERPIKDGRSHGVIYSFDEPGKLSSSEPCRNGRVHGTVRQYAHDGRLLGTYAMRHGTGIDLWRQERRNGTAYLSEVWHYQDGLLHGFEWWLGSDRIVYSERHWQRSQLHGIEREWNSEGRLRRGFPKYWIHGVRVTKRQYLRAAAKDATLPPFRDRDNRPRRTFPPEIAVHLT